MITLIKSHLVAIYFALGSIGLFVLILFVDAMLGKVFHKPKLNLDHDSRDELERGLQSLNQALHDSVITDEEYQKFSSDLINKYPPDDKDVNDINAKPSA